MPVRRPCVHHVHLIAETCGFVFSGGFVSCCFCLATQVHHKLVDALVTVFLQRRHGLLNASDDVAWRVGGQQATLGESLVQNFRSLGRTLSREHLEHGGSKRVDIHHNGETVAVAVARLLERGVARCAAADGGARLWLSALVILFGEAEIDEHGLAVGSHHHVGRFHIEVQHLAAVHETYGSTYLPGQPDGLFCGETAQGRLGYRVVKAHAVDEFHGVVGRAVGNEHLQYTHDVGMLQRAEVACLALELLAVIAEQSALRRAAACHGVARASVHLFHEKLLHCNIHVAVECAERALHLHLCLVGYAEGALAECLYYLVVVSLAVQDGARGDG